MALPLRWQPTSRSTTSVRKLTVVPGRRRAARFAISLTVLVCIVMMGAIYLHTRIAERQLEIDQLQRSVLQAQEDFDVLRAQRADLRSLTHLSKQALALGMEPGVESDFISVDPMVLAVTIARTGEMPIAEIVPGSTARLEPLDQFRLVKAVSAEAP